MSAAGFQIREFRRSDFVDEARIRTEIDPIWSVTAEEMERRENTFVRPPQVLHKNIAELTETSAVIGVGRLGTDPESFDPRTFWINVIVDRKHQGRGVGRELAQGLLARGREEGATRIWAEVMEEDHRAVEFLRLQGFKERRRAWRSRLIVETAAELPNRAAELSQAGVSFPTLAELDLTDDQTVRKLHDLNSKVSADEPRLGVYTPITLEQFVGMELQGPYFLPEAYFLARVGPEFVGLSTLRRSSSEPDSLNQAFTGVIREYRGQGIATELKRRGTEYARRHGYRSIVTGNDSLNRPMLAINKRLGYRPENTRIVGELLLGD